MRLYHFTSSRFGLEAIRDQRLKVAQVETLNDPFDVMGIALKDRRHRTKARQLRNRIASHFGLVCLAGNWHHPLLWGHYADKHSGVCLGFDVDETQPDFHAVNYVSARPTPQHFGRKSYVEMTEGDLYQLLAMKFDAWRYENEFRLFVGLDSRDPISGLYFHPFSDQLRLREVLVGDRSPITRQQLSAVLGSMSTEVEVAKTRPAFNSFEVVKQQRASKWK